MSGKWPNLRRSQGKVTTMRIFETFKENLRKSYDELRKNLCRFSKNPRKILNSFENWARRNNSVYAKRDTHFYCCRCLSVCLSVGYITWRTVRTWLAGSARTSSWRHAMTSSRRFCCVSRRRTDSRALPCQRRPIRTASVGVAPSNSNSFLLYVIWCTFQGGSVAEWLACWTRTQNGRGSNRSRDAVG